MAENKMEMDPEVLRTTARKVETSAGDVRKELKRFTSVIEGLSSTWSSEVKDRFLQNYQKDRAALLEMAEQYTEVAEGLLGIADELEQTEEEISSQIRAAAKSGCCTRLYREVAYGRRWNQSDQYRGTFAGSAGNHFYQKIHCSEYRCDLCDLSQTAGLLCRGERR